MLRETMMSEPLVIRKTETLPMRAAAYAYETQTEMSGGRTVRLSSMGPVTGVSVVITKDNGPSLILSLIRGAEAVLEPELGTLVTLFWEKLDEAAALSV
jgi:hypothetical protein